MIPTKRTNGKVRPRTALPCCCNASHATWQEWTRCYWRTARSVDNDPPVAGPCWAVTSHCARLEGGRGGPALVLFADREEAKQRKKLLDEFGCCAACQKNRHYHLIVNLQTIVTSGAYRRDAPIIWCQPFAFVMADLDRRHAVEADAAARAPR